MSAKGYVVRGKDKRGNVVTGDGIETTAAAVGAQRTLIAAGCTDVVIFGVAEDGTEERLPSYEEALTRLDAVYAAAEDVCSDYTEDGETKGPLSLRINRLIAALAAQKART